MGFINKCLFWKTSTFQQMNKYEKIIFWLKFSLKLNDYSSCGLQQCYTTVSMKEIQSNAHQNFIVCKESMTYLNQILSECGLTCGLLCLLTTKDKCLKKVNKQGICGTAPDLTSHFYCCFFLKTCKKKKKKFRMEFVILWKYLSTRNIQAHVTLGK